MTGKRVQDKPPAALPPLAAWGVSADLLPLHGGHRNSVLRTKGSGPSLVFKSTKRSEAALQWLADLHDFARACGLFVPTMVRSLRGRLAEDGWTCEPFVEGQAATRRDLAALSRPLGAFHLKTKDICQRPGFASSKVLLVEVRAGDVDLGAMGKPAARRCRAAWAAFAAGPCSAIHGDLGPANLLRCPDGRLALLDWDEARRDLTLFDRAHIGPCTPLAQQAVMAWEVACSWQQEPDYAKSLVHLLPAA